MVVEERVRTARTILEAADMEFASGDVLQGSEELWGAASHAMMAVAQQRGCRFNSHGALKEASRLLGIELNDRSIRDQVSIAEKFHGNFYHQWMPDIQVEQDRPIVREFVERVLSLEGFARTPA